MPGVREWLTRKQKETRRGRAELRLAERAALWQAKRENRHLPAWWEWLNIRLLTRPKDWTEPQRKMMRRSSRYHLLRGLFLAVLLTVGVVTGLVVQEGFVEQNHQTKAAGLVRRLLDAEVAGVPEAVREIGPYRQWADPLLRDALAEAADDPPRRLRASLALLPADASQADYLFDRLLDATPAEVPVLVNGLQAYQEGRHERLWQVSERPDKGREGKRLRAACALAAYDPDSSRWDQVRAAVVAQLVAENPVYLGHWLDGFRPVKDQLLRPLGEVFHDRAEGRSAERLVAANILAEYADRPEDLADFLLDADARQFAALYPRFASYGTDALQPLTAELARKPQPRWDDQPLDPSWRVADAALVRQIEAAHGLVEQRFALCQTLPLAEFVPLAERLRACGYRPIRCRPYAAVPGVLVAAVWTRDSRAWQLTPGLSAAEARDQKDQRRQEGWEPVDVAGYLDGGQERYAIVWVKAKGQHPSDWYVGVA